MNPSKKVSININGRNLLIVGDNGSGKTLLLNSIINNIYSMIPQQGRHRITDMQNRLAYLKNPPISNNDPRSSQEIEEAIETLEKELIQLENPCLLHFNNPSLFENLVNNNVAIIRLFSANRQADISNSGLANRLTAKIYENPHENLSKDLEQHLVNLKVRAALDTYCQTDSDKPLKIEEWFDFFTHNLRSLFEDDTLELQFDPTELNFKIHQHGKNPYSFQQLSSGYSSILNIYAHLLMHTEYTQITPDELEGVALIDEIDAHLHVSLQRKIFPFLTKSFPKIQFIVTTHSPFVLTSVDDALIYDLTDGLEHNDLSMYSFESVAEGLLGVPPISKKFENMLKHLVEFTSLDIFDTCEAEKTLKKILPHLGNLDPESQMFYQIARNKTITAKSREQKHV